MTTIPCVFRPARQADLAPEHLPTIPAWWPINRDDGTAVPTEAERTHMRRLRAVAEAVRGPIDGQRGEVQIDASGPPAVFAPLGEATIQYRLSVRETTRDLAVYRYDPTCPAHRGMMAAVEQAFTEAGPDYITEAREDVTDARTPEFAPPLEW